MTKYSVGGFNPDYGYGIFKRKWWSFVWKSELSFWTCKEHAQPDVDERNKGYFKMWHIGQRVVCVDDSNWSDEHIKRPIKGGIYTIREIDTIGGIDGLWLEEIINPIKTYSAGVGEAGFKQTRFKPLDEKRLDIFREMLTVKEREKERTQ